MLGRARRRPGHDGASDTRRPSPCRCRERAQRDRACGLAPLPRPDRRDRARARRGCVQRRRLRPRGPRPAGDRRLVGGRAGCRARALAACAHTRARSRDACDTRRPRGACRPFRKLGRQRRGGPGRGWADGSLRRCARTGAHGRPRRQRRALERRDRGRHRIGRRRVAREPALPWARTHRFGLAVLRGRRLSQLSARLLERARRVRRALVSAAAPRCARLSRRVDACRGDGAAAGARRACST